MKTETKLIFFFLFLFSFSLYANESLRPIKVALKQSHSELSNEEIDKMPFSKAMEVILRPFQQMSEKELEKTVFTNLENPKLKNIILNNPKHKIFLIRLIKDNKAIVKLIEILENEAKIIRFASVFLISVLFGMILRHFIRTKENNFVTVFGLFLLRIFIMLIMRIGIVIYFFGSELYPTYKIFLNIYINQ